MPPPHWKPLVLANVVRYPEELVAETARCMGLSAEDALDWLKRQSEACPTYINHLYQVQVFRVDDEMVQLNIRRRDGRPIFRDWRHFQQIKNELVGEECEAVELYPAESRLVDSSNKYHLFCSTDPTFRFPFGWTARDVQDDTGVKRPGLKQRRLK